MKVEFKAKIAADLNIQVSEWRLRNPDRTVTAVNPVEMLPLVMSSPYPSHKLEAKDAFRIVIEYEET